MNDKIVNSWNEWDELEEIVVGIADYACFEPTESGNHPKLRDKKLAQTIPFPSGKKSPKVLAKANEELNGLAYLLKDQGVIVRRPEKFDYSKSIKTPHFEVPNQYCGVCPRDVMITLGNEILEATMSRRARFFEYLPYRKLIYEYWNRDPDLIWNAAPKPSMQDSMYLEKFWEFSLEERFQRMHDEEREEALQKLLQKHGFDVFPLPFRNVFEFGGSFHCATWDIRRTGKCEDYFPNLNYTPIVKQQLTSAI